MIPFSEGPSQQPLLITVRTLRAQNDGSEISVGIVLENGEHREQKSLLLTVEQYYELKPQKGPISEELYDRLEEASTLCRAMRCGENLLSYGANSVRMLSQKLVRHGFRRDIAAAAAEKLCERGLIDEQGDMRREVEKCLRKLWGSRRIVSHLWSRGFSSELMSQLPDMLEEISFSENCAALIKKHYGTPSDDRDAQRKMLASLSRYGYSLTEIREALRLLNDNKR